MVKCLGAEMKVSLHDLEIVQFEFSATTKGGDINSQVKIHCVPSKVKANSDWEAVETGTEQI